MTPDAKLIEEANPISEELAALRRVLEKIHGDGEALMGASLRRTLLAVETLAARAVTLESALSASATREKEWHDHIMLASGGHATTPETAAALTRQLRDDLDGAKGRERSIRAILEDHAAQVAGGFEEEHERIPEIAAALAQETK